MATKKKSPSKAFGGKKAAPFTKGGKRSGKSTKSKTKRSGAGGKY